MGQTPAELQREIEDLRREATFAVEELEHRLRRATDIQAQVEDHPYIAGGALLGLLAGIGFFSYRLVANRRRPATSVATLRQRVAGAVHKVEQAKDVEGLGAPSMLKRVLWAMLSAGTVALAGLLAKRLAASLWMTAMHESPPDKTA
jgi:hypothetical protein